MRRSGFVWPAIHAIISAFMAHTIWLARHGNRQDFVDPDWPATADFPHDPGLSPDGLEQAKKLGHRLKEERIDHVFASPFLRTVQTAHAVADILDRPISLEPGLGEWLNQAWFGITPLRRELPVLAEDYPRIDLGYEPLEELRYPETKELAFARCLRTIKALSERYEGSLLLVGHAASVLGCVATFLDCSDEDRECALCAIYQMVQLDGSWKLVLDGDVAHLGEATAPFRFI